MMSSSFIRPILLLFLVGSSCLEASDEKARGNHLLKEESAYLRQHAHNPVDWYPYQRQAFELAEKQGKLLFLSIGYSSCHWCHVMKEESFEDKEVASYLNEHFISVKLDREEYPAIDEVFMTATMILNQGDGGWPNNLLLTPEGLPFLGFTYLPKEELLATLKNMKQAFEQSPEQVNQTATTVKALLEQWAQAEGRRAQSNVINYEKLFFAQAKARLKQLADPDASGPKFVPYSLLRTVLESEASPVEVLEYCYQTLRMAAAGGLMDQVGGGFHRYSTDGRYLLPHFEKMLYDNAQMSLLYSLAYQRTQDELFAQVAQRTYDFVLEEMTDPQGVFYSSFDARSEGEEGKFYLFSEEELSKFLKDPGFLALYQVRKEGNFNPETGPSKQLNLLHLKEAILLPEKRLKQLKQLKNYRSKRVPPFLDKKIQLSWNALMIESLALGAKVLGKPAYLLAAQRAASKLQSSGSYAHIWPYSANSILNLEDLALFSKALLALNDKKASLKLTEKAIARFQMESGWLARTTLERPLQWLRPVAREDGMLPSGASALLHSLKAHKKTKEWELVSPWYRSLAQRSLTAYASFFPLFSDASIEKKSETKLKPVTRKKDKVVRPVELQSHPLEIQAVASRSQKKIFLKIIIEEDWHINSSNPLQDYLIATRLSTSQKGVALGKVKYPEGEELEMGFLDEPLSVYSETIEIEAEIKSGAQGDTITCKLYTQACSDDECLPPETHELKIPVGEVQDR